MKYLISTNQDNYLGNPIEIINNKSKYLGYRGWIDGKLYKDNKYKVFINAQNYEDQEEPHIMYVDYFDIERWVRIIPIESLQ